MTQQNSITISPWASQTTRGTRVSCSPDKSLTHRAFMFSAIAEGTSSIINPLMGADCLSTMEVFRQLGVVFTPSADADRGVQVDSLGWRQWKSPQAPLDFGNSGTTARLLMGLFAGTPNLFVVAYGDESLSSRPMARVVEPIRRMGGQIWGRDNGRLLPVAISGQNLRAVDHLVDKSSAQVKSSLLLAALGTAGKTTICLPVGSRNHTELILRRQGAKCESRVEGGMEVVEFYGPFSPIAARYVVPGDPSSAAFFAVLAGIHGISLKVENVLENSTRCGYEVVLRQMGWSVAREFQENSIDWMEPTSDLVVGASDTYTGTVISAEQIPTLVDEIPVLAVAAAFAKSPSQFLGLQELRVKESDRLLKTAELLKCAGAKCDIQGNDLLIAGGLQRANPFVFDPAGDHRLAMAASVLATRSEGQCRIIDPGCVAVSFPTFFEQLTRVAQN